MKLNDAAKGGTYIIDSISLPIEIYRRLEALGMIKGTMIHVLNAKSRGILIVKVRGTRFAIGKGISQNIQVNDVLRAGGNE